MSLRLRTAAACMHAVKSVVPAGSWKSTRQLVMTRSTTAIVMADNRAPALTSTPTYPALAFALNALYACGHGYDLLYYRMASPTCAHPLQGARDASYCKMPAIAAALQAGYDSVAFVDSDSFFLQRNVSLPSLVARYAPPPPHAAAAPLGAWFACDLPQLGERPNGGFHLWRRGDGAERLLRTWWPRRRPLQPRRDYEQHALQWALSPGRRGAADGHAAAQEHGRHVPRGDRPSTTPRPSAGCG